MKLDRYTCLETVQFGLDDYVDRELSADEQHEVERHLERCDRCLGGFRFEAGVLDELKAKLRRVKVPDCLPTARSLSRSSRGSLRVVDGRR
jgi:anti-sigma factor RsiW